MTDPVARINALTTNARNTWFVLLGVLVFVAITLFGVEDIDFYGVNRATKLPLVDVSVPTRLFFVAAPILIAAVFGYFHLYLIRLFDALGDAPARIGNRPLGDAVSPWLVSDAALYLRAKLRQDSCARRRPMEGPAMALNFLLAWGFGWGVLAMTWWWSMPGRTLWLTGLAAFCLLLCIVAGMGSLTLAVFRMGRTRRRETYVFDTALFMAVLLAAVLLLPAFTYLRTAGPTEYLAPVNLVSQAVTERPDDWLPHDIARKERRAKWCNREGFKCSELTEEQEGDFTDEWRRLRASALASVLKPEFSRLNSVEAMSAVTRLQNDGASGWEADLNADRSGNALLVQSLLARTNVLQPDLRGADLRGAHLAGAEMNGTNLRGARLTGADLENAKFIGAQLANADLSEAQAQNADLRGAQLQDAVLRRAQLQDAVLRRAQLQDAVLIAAQLQDAVLFAAQLQGADLHWAQLQDAVLRGAQLQDADLSEAQLQGADLRFSALTGTPENHTLLQSTNLSASIKIGGALRFVNLSDATLGRHTDWRNTFLDRSVIVPDQFRRRMGTPCQWIDLELDDEKFYGHWRGWIEDESNPYRNLDWEDLPVPDAYLDVEPIAPTNCKWKTKPFVHHSGGR